MLFEFVKFFHLCWIEISAEPTIPLEFLVTKSIGSVMKFILSQYSCAEWSNRIDTERVGW